MGAKIEQMKLLLCLDYIYCINTLFASITIFLLREIVLCGKTCSANYKNNVASFFIMWKMKDRPAGAGQI